MGKWKVDLPARLPSLEELLRRKRIGESTFTLDHGTLGGRKKVSSFLEKYVGEPDSNEKEVRREGGRVPPMAVVEGCSKRKSVSQ